MFRMHPCFIPALFAALFPAAGGRAAIAADVPPTAFQQAIHSWMGVVAFLAESEGEMDDDEGDEAEDGDEDRRGRGEGRRRHREHAEHGPDAGGDAPGRHGPRGWQSRHGMRPEAHGHEPRMSPGMRHDPRSMLDDIVERLSRIERKLDAAPHMGNPWSPRPHGSANRGGRQPLPEEARREMDERMRAMMQQGRSRMEQAREKMEQARKKFLEMEERIKTLEAEVDRLKAAR